MPDMEKVIKALETCRKTDCANCEYNTEVCLIDEIISDALELLKEQRKQKFFVDAEGKITPLPIVFPNCPLKEQEKIVRCKDCKHGKIHGIDVECVAHEEVSYDPEPWHPLDWFCADGERKEGR